MFILVTMKKKILILLMKILFLNIYEKEINNIYNSDKLIENNEINEQNKEDELSNTILFIPNKKKKKIQ